MLNILISPESVKSIVMKITLLFFSVTSHAQILLITVLTTFLIFCVLFSFPIVKYRSMQLKFRVLSPGNNRVFAR